MNRLEQLTPLYQFLHSEAARLNLRPEIVLKYLKKYTGLGIIHVKRSVFLSITAKTKPPAGFLGQQPGEIPFKEWLITKAEQEDVSTAAIRMRILRGKAQPPPLRRVNGRVIYVTGAKP